jgi:hypothetical protein
VPCISWHAIGSDIEVASGTYRVEQTEEKNLRLVRDGGQAIEIPATTIPHQESVTASIAVAIVEEGQEDQVHLVLFLPQDDALDAVG